VVCILWVLEFVATHLPPSEEIRSLPGSDKHQHFAGYFVLSGLLMFWNGVSSAARPRRMLTVVLILAVYAAADELLQPLVHRDAELLDWAADLFGAVVGAAVGMVVARVLHARGVE
jgi:VanZ family protein